MNLDKHFKKTVGAPLDSLTAEDLKPIALAVWHENYTPNLDSLNLEESKKAGYVLDRLMRFSCVSNDRKGELMLLVRQMKDLTAKVTSLENTFLSEDPLAAKWNLSEDIAQAMQGLLPYQTRHYTHN